MAAQQTVQIIGDSNNTIAEVTTTINALLETPKACSLEASGSVGNVLGTFSTVAGDFVVLAFRWEDAFSNAFIKKVCFSLGYPNIIGVAGVLTLKLNRVNDFGRQYGLTNVAGVSPTTLSIPPLNSGQPIHYSASGGNFNNTDNVQLPTSGSLVTIGSAGANNLLQVTGPTPLIDPNPLAAITISRRAVAGQRHGFNTGGVSINLPGQSLWEVSEGDYPIYLRKGEGIIISTNNPALATGIFGSFTLCFDAVPVTNQEY